MSGRKWKRPFPAHDIGGLSPGWKTFSGVPIPSPIDPKPTPISWNLNEVTKPPGAPDGSSEALRSGFWAEGGKNSRISARKHKGCFLFVCFS